MKELRLNNISREKAYELIRVVRNFIKDNIDLLEYLDKNTLKGYNTLESEDVEIDFDGVSNGFISQLIHAITGCEVEVIGEVNDLFSCPCCGYKSLTEAYDINEGTGYDTCPYCAWEDDGTTDIDSKRSINGGSIQDYRNKINNSFNRFYINKWLK